MRAQAGQYCNIVQMPLFYALVIVEIPQVLALASKYRFPMRWPHRRPNKYFRNTEPLN